MKRLLLIDALNQFLRAYIVNPSLSKNGEPIGGTVGFVKIIQKLIRETKPDEVVICWDGGSGRRKSIKKTYKDGRKPLRLNRGVETLTAEQELQNKIWQQTRLIEYLNEFPIMQLMVEDVEADDIISYVCSLQKYSDWQKVIVSSDKDFFQLCDETTVLHRPIQKVYLNKHKIIEEHGIHPVNFALARAIAGDVSDNLPGVGHAGLKTIAKRFPVMKEEESVEIKDIFDICEAQEKPLKIHENILGNKNRIRTNYKLMQLYAPLISPQYKMKIRHTIENADQTYFNKSGIRVMMLEDGIETLSLADLFASCNRIVSDHKSGDTSDAD